MEVEENPFEEEVVANQWIQIVEEHPHDVRDNELYPLVECWIKNTLPTTFLDLGCGQGVFYNKFEKYFKTYIGIDSSTFLINRANNLYGERGAIFNVASVYDTNLGTASVDAVLSVNVLFHVQDLNRMAKEMFRILKPRGGFLISTVNPLCAEKWISFYSDLEKEDKKHVGKVSFPTLHLSKNTFFNHSLEEIFEYFEKNNLKIERIEDLGLHKGDNGRGLFLNIYGFKKGESN